LLFREKNKKPEERTCVTKDNNQQMGNRIGHRKRKRKSGAYMVACKTEKEQPETPSDTGKNEHRKKGQNRKWTWKIGHGANRKCIRGNGVGIVYPDKIWPQNKKQKREKKTTVVYD